MPKKKTKKKVKSNLREGEYGYVPSKKKKGNPKKPKDLEKYEKEWDKKNPEKAKRIAKDVSVLREGEYGYKKSKVERARKMGKALKNRK